MLKLNNKKKGKWFDKLKSPLKLNIPKMKIPQLKDNLKEEKLEKGLPKLKRVFGKFKG